MKTTIRQNTFETNSSSVHAFVIGNSGKENRDNIDEDNNLHVDLQEFGWNAAYSDAAGYLISITKGTNEEQFWIDRIKSVLGVDDIVIDSIMYGKYGLTESRLNYLLTDEKVVIQRLREDDDLLRRFLLDADSRVEVGNDQVREFEPEVVRDKSAVPAGAELFYYYGG